MLAASLATFTLFLTAFAATATASAAGTRTQAGAAGVDDGPAQRGSKARASACPPCVAAAAIAIRQAVAKSAPKAV